MFRVGSCSDYVGSYKKYIGPDREYIWGSDTDLRACLLWGFGEGIRFLQNIGEYV